MASKSELAATLKSLGFSHLEIAAELYPQDYQRYLETRDRRLYQLLKKRVWKLLRIASGPGDGGPVDSRGGWTRDELEDSGGEREPLEYRAPEPLYHPRTRKAGLGGAQRQLIEYEQYLYHLWRVHVAEYDPKGMLWGTARFIHGRAFMDYYREFGVNVWGYRGRVSRVARTYAYSVLATAALLHGMLHVRIQLERALGPDRELLPRVLPIIFKHVL